MCYNVLECYSNFQIYVRQALNIRSYPFTGAEVITKVLFIMNEHFKKTLMVSEHLLSEIFEISELFCVVKIILLFYVDIFFIILISSSKTVMDECRN